MTEIRASRISRAPTNRGFQEIQSKDIKFRLIVQGRVGSIGTKMSHGERMADDWLLGRMARNTSNSCSHAVTYGAEPGRGSRGMIQRARNSLSGASARAARHSAGAST